MRLRTAIWVALLAASLSLPTSAFAAESRFGLASPTYVPPGVNDAGVYTTPLPPGAKVATSTYNLDWTIGAAGKSGCLVCHGDRNLVRIVDGKLTSLYVDAAMIDESAHVQTLCTDCHVDFAYKTPHPAAATSGDGWRAIARSACKNCHRNQFLDWANSAHSTAGGPGRATGATSTAGNDVGAPNSSAPGKPRPLCGDCHGGHAIPSKTDSAAMEAVRSSALEMCGQCHVGAASTYTDYYHGAAYRRGANDAPACWQCHNTHLVLPSAQRQSWSNRDSLPTTCGQCHKGTLNDQYTEYAQLVHRKEVVLHENPVFAVAHSARQAISNAFYQVGQVFRRSGS